MFDNEKYGTSLLTDDLRNTSKIFKVECQTVKLAARKKAKTKIEINDDLIFDGVQSQNVNGIDKLNNNARNNRGSINTTLEPPVRQITPEHSQSDLSRNQINARYDKQEQIDLPNVVK